MDAHFMTKLAAAANAAKGVLKKVLPYAPYAAAAGGGAMLYRAGSQAAKDYQLGKEIRRQQEGQG